MNNRKYRILVDLILIILGIIFLVFGIKDVIDKYNSEKVTDATLFKREYKEVSEDNVYKYLNLKDAEKMLKEETGIILIGNSLNSWTQVLVGPLNEIAKEEKREIYYLSTKEIDKESKNYKNILKILNKKELEVPNLIFIKEGKILKIYSKEDLYDKEYDGAPIEYWTEEQKTVLKEEISKDIESLK